jgi:hypothetical protein
MGFTQSCNQKEPTIDIEPSKIVINGLITTDSLVGITLTRSSAITEWVHVDDFLQGAKIHIYKNDQLADSLDNRNITLGYYYFYRVKNYAATRLVPESGNEYKIEVKYPGFETASATTIIPQKVTIDKIDTLRIDYPYTNLYESNHGLFCQVSFSDPADEENYYLFMMLGSSGVRNLDNVSFLCNDAIVEETLNHGSIPIGVAFSDKKINGQKYKLALIFKFKELFIASDSIKNPFYRQAKMYFNLYSINKDYFNYLKELNLFYANYRNPLADPVQVSSNIKGGYGFFSGAAVSTDSVIINH